MLPSYVWYQDMADFAETIRDEAVGRRLARAIHSKGPNVSADELRAMPDRSPESDRGRSSRLSPGRRGALASLLPHLRQLTALRGPAQGCRARPGPRPLHPQGARASQSRTRGPNWLRRVWYPATTATGLGQLVDDKGTRRRRYVGLGFHDLRRANATGLVAAGVDIKTAQALLGHSNAQLTLGLYAQAVVSLGVAAVDSMAERFGLPARDGGATERCEAGSEGQDDGET